MLPLIFFNQSFIVLFKLPTPLFSFLTHYYKIIWYEMQVVFLLLSDILLEINSKRWKCCRCGYSFLNWTYGAAKVSRKRKRSPDTDLDFCTIFSPATLWRSEAMNAFIVYLPARGKEKTYLSLWLWQKSPVENENQASEKVEKKENSCCSRCWLIHGGARQSIWRFYCICLFKWWTAVPPVDL